MTTEAPKSSTSSIGTRAEFDAEFEKVLLRVRAQFFDPTNPFKVDDTANGGSYHVAGVFGPYIWVIPMDGAPEGHIGAWTSFERDTPRGEW